MTKVVKEGLDDVEATRGMFIDRSGRWVNTFGFWTRTITVVVEGEYR